MSSSLGVLPGSVAGAYAYRHQLHPLRAFLRRAVVPVAIGSAAGALLLLLLPARVFGDVVPVLLVLAAVLVAIQPRVAARVAARRTPIDGGGEPRTTTAKARATSRRRAAASCWSCCSSRSTAATSAPGCR